MDRRERQGAPSGVSPRARNARRSAGGGGGYRDPSRDGYRDSRQPLDQRGPVLTPARVTLVLAVLIGAALLFVALVVQRGQDVPFLAAACAVLGFALAAFAVNGAVATYRNAANGRGARAFGLAFLGGLAGIGAFGFLALALIFGVLWSPPS
jgi:hypothetical protein